MSPIFSCNLYFQLNNNNNNSNNNKNNNKNQKPRRDDNEQLKYDFTVLFSSKLIFNL